MFKQLKGDCSECESEYLINYTEVLASKEYPEYCPFCGSMVDDLSETFIEDGDDEEETWN